MISDDPPGLGQYVQALAAQRNRLLEQLIEAGCMVCGEPVTTIETPGTVELATPPQDFDNAGYTIRVTEKLRLVCDSHRRSA